MNYDTRNLVQIVQENEKLKREIEKLQIENWKLKQDLQEETKGIDENSTIIKS